MKATPATTVEASRGQQTEPGGRAPAPGPLGLVQRFINTWNHEFPVEHDELRDTRAATSWLRENKLIRDIGQPELTNGELDELRRLREAIRALATANITQSPDPSALRTINAAAAAAPVVFTTGDD